MNSTPNLTALFLFAILAAVILGSIFSFLAIYVARENRSAERGRIAAKESSQYKEPQSLPETGFYYLRTGRLRNSMDMKVRLYSPEEHGRELGYTSEASRSGEFVAALKAYGYYGDHWHEMACEQAVSSLGLKAEDCEVDERCGVLLLRKLPEGLPAKARENLDQPEDLRLFAGEDGASRNATPDHKEYRG